MPKINPLSNIWAIVKEADLRPLREQAEHPVRLAIVGQPGSGRAELAERLRRDPQRPELPAMNTPITILDLDTAAPAPDADLIILMIPGGQADTQRERGLLQTWNSAGKQALVFINLSPALLTPPAAAVAQPALPGSTIETGEAAPTQPAPRADAPKAGQAEPLPLLSSAPASGALQPAPSRRSKRARTRGVVRGSVHDDLFLTQELAPAVIELIPDRAISLGRYFPLFRVSAAHYLINDTSFSNSVYAFSTALAETVPVLDVPVVVADTIILTKNQLFMVYKLGLALGFSTRWQDYVAEFGGVLGSGLLWRGLARTLVGLVPVWGIVPKTAISYAGTFTVGNAVLQWYLTGRHLDPGQIKQLYLKAFENGKAIARRLLRRSPGGTGPGAAAAPMPRRKLQLHLPRLKRRRREQPGGAAPAAMQKPCPDCGKYNAADARFCQYCGHVFS